MSAMQGSAASPAMAKCKRVRATACVARVPFSARPMDYFSKFTLPYRPGRSLCDSDRFDRRCTFGLFLEDGLPSSVRVTSTIG